MFKILFSLAILLIFSLVLVKSVKWFIASVSKIAHFMGISAYTISFLLVAVATSLPEITVSITSALEKKTILSYGNALGANIALFTLVIAVAGILSKGNLTTKKIFKEKDVFFTVIFSLLAVIVAFDGKISRIEGVLLLAAYVLYSIEFIKKSKGLERALKNMGEIHLKKELLIFVGSLALLVFSSEMLVNQAVHLSSLLSVDLGFIGLTLTSLGTTLPELTFTIGLVKSKEHDEILGTIIGSAAANSTLVIGIGTLIYPIQTLNGGITTTTLLFSILTTLAFFSFAKSGKNLSVVESILLLFVYISFLGIEYFIQRPF